jgi:long-subunit fatty acid transport protein
MNYKSYRRLFLALIPTILAYNSAISQIINGSPYSNYGLGEMNTFAFSGQSSSGYTSTSFYSNRDFTFTNPASVAGLQIKADAGNLSVLKFGAFVDLIDQKSAIANKTYTDGNFSYMALGMPIMDKKIGSKTVLNDKGKEVEVRVPLKWGVSFGLLPFSNVAYGNELSIDTSFGSYDNIFNGTGGISRIFLNNGFQIGNNFSFGHSVRFIFGQIDDFRLTIFPDSLNIKGQQDHRNLDLKGVQNNFGAIYKFETNNLSHTFGATYTLPSTLRAGTERLVQSMDYNSNGALLLEDTTYYSSNDQEDVKLPSGFTLGYTLQKENKWLVSAEYKRENWNSFDWFNSNDSFSNSDEISVGFVLNPHRFSPDNFVKPEIRAGFKYKKSYLTFQEINGGFTQLEESGITFGIGIPLKKNVFGKGWVKNMLDIGAEYVTRGTTDGGLVRENIFRITAGFTFNDYWFERRKIK